ISAEYKQSVLKDFISDNPMVVAELLKKKPDLNDAKLACQLVKSIDRSEKWHGYYKKGLMVGGAIVGFVAVVGSGGTAAPLVGALAMGVTVASAADSLGEYTQAKKSYERLQRSGATRQIAGLDA